MDHPRRRWFPFDNEGIGEKMEIIKYSEEKKDAIIAQAVQLLNAGRIIIYPTDTCYGLGVDAMQPEAVKRLISYKTFRNDKPISVAVSSLEMFKSIAEVNQTAKNLITELLPGPFTIICKSKGTLAEGICSNRNTVGVRIPDYPFILELIETFGRPITTTSANVSYKKTPYSLKDLIDNTNDRQKSLIDAFLDFGELEKNKPSTVMDTTLDDVNYLRYGDKGIKYITVLETNSEEETRKIGFTQSSEIINRTKSPVIICLDGELGTGKTQFAKGMGKFLNISTEITSPTYYICREYDIEILNRKKFYHIDTYKLFEPEEIFDIGFKEMVNESSIVLIEWAGKISNIIQTFSSMAKIFWISFEHLDECKRKIRIGELIHENFGN
jgi:L-threonylcarbamoyladenylate synthase